MLTVRISAQVGDLQDPGLQLLVGIGAGEQFTPQPEVLTVREMLNRFIFLSDGSRVFDIVYPKHVLSMGDFRNSLIASYTITDTGTFGSYGEPKSQRIPNTQTWLESRQRLSVFGTTFDASAGMYVKDPLGKHCVNTWAGFDTCAMSWGALLTTPSTVLGSCCRGWWPANLARTPRPFNWPLDCWSLWQNGVHE